MSDVAFNAPDGQPVLIARGAVADLFEDDESGELLLSGAAGTGKSFGVMAWLHGYLLEYPGARALVVRKTHVSLTASTLVTLREKVLARDIANGHVSWFGGSAIEPPGYRYANGSFIAVGGMDRSSRVLSTEFDIVVADEAIELTAEDLDVIVTRLRNNKTPRQQLICMTNPGPPTHHLKVRCDSGRMRMLYSQHEDNPALYDMESGEWTEYGHSYLAKLETLTGVRYERLRWGKWVSADGLIFSEFNEAVHVVDPRPVSKTDRMIVSIDWGFTNPTSIQWWLIDRDGRMHLHREMYETQVLVEDWAKRIAQVYADNPEEPWPEAWITDHDAEDRKTLEKHLKIHTTPAIKAVTRGIQAVQSRLKLAGDGKPRLTVSRTALVAEDPALREAGKPVGYVAEIFGYIWAPKPVSSAGGKPEPEKPLKVNDHAMDNGRYAVAYLDLQPVKTGAAPTPARAAAARGTQAVQRYTRPVSSLTRAKAPKRYGGA